MVVTKILKTSEIRIERRWIERQSGDGIGRISNRNFRMELWALVKFLKNYEIIRRFRFYY